MRKNNRIWLRHTLRSELLNIHLILEQMLTATLDVLASNVEVLPPMQRLGGIGCEPGRVTQP